MRYALPFEFLPFLAAAAILFAAPAARATVFMKPGLMYLQNSDENAGTKTTTTRTLVDLGIDYAMDKGWAFGIIYGTETSRIESQTTFLGTTTTTITEASRTSFGPTVGWVSQKDGAGPYLLASYFLTSEYKVSTTVYKGWGYQATLGGRFKAGRAFLAVELNYKFFEYKESVNGTSTTSINPPRRQTYVDPMFSAFFEF